jgi:phosphatidylglycerophosphate synthase
MQIPNLITLSRILVAPLFAYAFMRGLHADHGTLWLWLALTGLILIEISDALDGTIARSINLV